MKIVHKCQHFYKCTESALSSGTPPPKTTTIKILLFFRMFIRNLTHDNQRRTNFFNTVLIEIPADRSREKILKLPMIYHFHDFFQWKSSVE